jgi:hypothetical protein
MKESSHEKKYNEKNMFDRNRIVGFAGVCERTSEDRASEINVGPHVRRGLNMAPMAIQFRDSTADQA